jgi:beta-lactam-binding protein with PASTA domain
MKKISIAVLAAVALTLSISPASQAASCVQVANEVGKNYQSAQDKWRSQSLVVLPAKDGKGLNRLAWIDSNWYVIGQSPKAGTCVKKYSTIRATILKYTD